ncbi:ThiF family adenylyltransferase [Rhodopseudomonas sp.]|uniref:ThiF family adenylyltransferase n=1 Tax=Rhodopseudomonas sp. TaxID=1078 RepID=UPI0039E60CD8
MSLPLQPADRANRSGATLKAWLLDLGDHFVAEVPKGSLRPGMVEGWRLKWRGRELEIQVDGDFPFSAPTVYLLGYTRAHAQPHVEHDGKLCLGVDPVPGEAVRTIQASLAAAFQLLTENESRKHEDDFREDFGLYWLNWATSHELEAKVVPAPEWNLGTTFGLLIRTANQIFVFPTKADAERFWINRTDNPPKKVKSALVIPIQPLPAPDRYPATTAELWSLVEARSPDGTQALTQLIANDPFECFVILSGLVPSGREHFATLRLRRPERAPGQPLHRRAMREHIKRSDDPERAHFERYLVERLATSRLDSASTRLLGPPRRQLSVAKVVIVGCGSLGSGVARLLAQSGVEYLWLVDPDTLGWENIRRHHLGAGHVRLKKAAALARSIRADLPMINCVKGYAMTFAAFARDHSDILSSADLVVSCTGSWPADASVENALRLAECKARVVYGWMEAHALAAHAVALDFAGPRLSDGFNEYGEFLLPATTGGLPPPPECGGGSSPYGAIELVNSQALVARMAVDVLRGVVQPPLWRTWLSEASALRDAEASWSPSWIERKGKPSEMGGVVEGDWSF